RAVWPSHGSRGEADEGVAGRVDLGAGFGRAAAVGGSAITPRRRAALAVTAARAVAAVQDHLDVDLRGKLAREIPVQVQLLAGHDEEVVAHDLVLSDPTPARQMDRRRASARPAARASRDSRRGLPPRLTGPPSSSSSS